MLLTSPDKPSAPWLAVLKSLRQGRAPGQAVIQYTDRCNASCNQCGMRKQNKYPRAKLDPLKLGELIPLLAKRNVQAISFTGGEPLLYLDEICALAGLARDCGIASVRTGTNGFNFANQDSQFETRIKDLAAKLKNSGFNAFWVSLDSADPKTHEANRGLPGVCAGLKRGLPIFHAQGLYPAANLGLNRNLGGSEPLSARPGERIESFTERLKHGLRGFFNQAIELGFKTANVCYPMRGQGPDGYSPVYAAATEHDCMSFNRFELRALFSALYEIVPEFRKRIRIFTPRSSLLAMLGQGPGPQKRGYPCLGGRDFFFIDAKDMRIYPCGYRGQEPLTLDKLSQAPQANCELCDWECFRDPSHTFGPLLDLARNPITTLINLAQSPAWTKTWLQDLRYYKDCSWFNATVAPK